MIREFIEEKMSGNISLSEFDTEREAFDHYFSNPHNNYYPEDQSWFISIQENDTYAYVAFAWCDGSFKARREMVAFSKTLYKAYTLDMDLPIYYSGKRNYFKHHCKIVGDDVWQLVL